MSEMIKMYNLTKRSNMSTEFTSNDNSVIEDCSSSSCFIDNMNEALCYLDLDDSLDNGIVDGDKLNVKMSYNKKSKFLLNNIPEFNLE